ncbi:Nuclear aminoacylation-dependent tRNA export pathway component [Saitoella coloradoensis]
MWSAALGALGRSSGPAFGYSLGERIGTHEDSIWTLHHGTKKDDRSDCSIFAYDSNKFGRDRLVLAQNAAKKLRTMRHPGVIKFLDSVEADGVVYIATERVQPLSWDTKRHVLDTESMRWGVYSVTSTMKFINEDANCVHGNVRLSSIFTTESGEWRVGGFEVLTAVTEGESGMIYTYGGLAPSASRYAPPEVGNSGWSGIHTSPKATDAWGLATLIYESFNGPFNTTSDLQKQGKIPSDMFAHYKRLLLRNPKTRLSISNFLDQGRRERGFLKSPLISVTENLSNLTLLNETERNAFLGNLEESVDQLPEPFMRLRLLPELIKSFEFGGGGEKVYKLIVKIASKLDEEQQEAILAPAVIRLFQSADPNIRLALLDSLEGVVGILPNSAVSSKIFPNLSAGFTDANPIVREATLKAILPITPKLSDRILNNDLLKHLARTHVDPQPGIRTNTTVVLGHIASHLSGSTRKKVLTAAFSKSLKDPFVHARHAGLRALEVTVEYFDREDLAGRLLSGMCPLLVDGEKIVREEAARVIDVFLKRIKELTKDMPETLIDPNAPQHISELPKHPPPPGSFPSTANFATTLLSSNSDAGMAGALAGWAVKSIASKVIESTGPLSAPAAAPPLRVPSAPAASTVTMSTFKPMDLKASKLSGRSASKVPPRPSIPVSSNTFGASNLDEDVDAWEPFEDEPKPKTAPPTSRTTSTRLAVADADDTGDQWGDDGWGEEEEDDAWE